MTSPTTAKRLKIALAGNPNSGKTTMFNVLTGTRQKVGNWPGVTVEKKEGHAQKFGYDLDIIDLPGTYSLTPFSIEEIVTRDFVLDENPDVVIDIIDASNLERSFYLATQLRELDCKVLFALNMADLARSRGININGEKLSELLGLPVVFTVGNKSQGIEAMLKRAIQLSEEEIGATQHRKVKYSKDIEEAIVTIQNLLESRIEPNFPYATRWTAIKLLEKDPIIEKRVNEHLGPAGQAILDLTRDQRKLISECYDDDPEIVMSDERYGFIAGLVKETVAFSTLKRVDLSRNIDLVLTNRFLGFPIFFLFIWGMFQLTFTLGAYPMAGIEKGVALISMGLDHLLPGGLLKDLLLNGIIAGVGSVIVFLPNILILFFCIALFEDTGYMARAAFLMDKVMHLIGLHGKSFIPMLMGFGCNVPAIMAARTLESNKDRILTILITPFMSCSARLPIYIILAGTFFGKQAGTIIFLLYLCGIVTAILTGRLFRTIFFKGADAPFVMELPPYRIPMFKSLMIHMWERSKMFLRKMGGIILIGSIIVWALSAFPKQGTSADYYQAQRTKIDAAYQAQKAQPTSQSRRVEAEHRNALKALNAKQIAAQRENSYMGRIGKWIAPVFKPVGIDWRGSISLVTGFIAKEIVISTMAVLYAVDEHESEGLKQALVTNGMTPLSALAMMVFVLFYVPCLATITTIRRETASNRWMLLSIGYTTTVAWLFSFIVYQGGRLLGF